MNFSFHSLLIILSNIEKNRKMTNEKLTIGKYSYKYDLWCSWNDSICNTHLLQALYTTAFVELIIKLTAITEVHLSLIHKALLTKLLQVIIRLEMYTNVGYECGFPSSYFFLLIRICSEYKYLSRSNHICTFFLDTQKLAFFFPQGEIGVVLFISLKWNW